MKGKSIIKAMSGEEIIIDTSILLSKVCPNCGKRYIVNDNSSEMTYVAKCKCGYDEKLSYILITDYATLEKTLYLLPNKMIDHIEHLETLLFELNEEISDLWSEISDLT